MADLGERMARVETRQDARDDSEAAISRRIDGIERDLGKRIENLEQRFWWLGATAIGALGTAILSKLGFK